MNKVFDRLEYDFEPKGNQIINFSDDAKRTMNAVPKFLDDWQFEALANEDTEGYVKNPITIITNSIISICSQIVSESANVANLSSISSTSSFIASNVAPLYIEHGDRLAGLVEPNEDTSLLPHYDTAMSIGKSLNYVVNQSDGIQNNSVIMGSFTSILVEEDLTAFRDKITGYPALIEASVYTETVLEFQDPPGENVEVTRYYSTLSPAQISAIQTDVSAISNFMTTRRTHDENFFTKSKEVMDDFSKLRKFKDMGQTENNLTRNFIGTEKLLNKLGN
jgi:hypothetical protein